MREVTDLAAAREASSTARELASVARELMTECMTAELAIARKDWQALHDAADSVNTLSVRFLRLRRSLLVKGITS